VIVSEREILVYILATTSFLIACSESADDRIVVDRGQPSQLDFEYISVRDEKIYTLHGLKYAVSMDGDFKVTMPINRVARFNDTPYRISLAAFISDDSALTIHAEEVADSSGASNYSHLPPAQWPDDSFRSSDPDCLQISIEEVEGEHDLLWLRQNGFEPSGSIVYAQFFSTTADMNSEIVISLLHRVASCTPASADSEEIEQLQAKTRVVRLQ
jgi:hypothetical protein